MTPLADVIRGSLHWKQPRFFEADYELVAGDDLVATLSFRSALGSFATAQTAGGSWTFKRVGFWKPRATVREEGAWGWRPPADCLPTVPRARPHGHS